MELCNIAVVKELLERHGFRFSKALGQNFIIDHAVPYEMARISGADAATGVLEIGPGIGPLTQELCRVAGKVSSVELDRALYPVLAETMAEFSNFHLIGGDIMKFDIPVLVQEEFPSLRPIVCANLPYNITSPVLTALVKAKCFFINHRTCSKGSCGTHRGKTRYGRLRCFFPFHAVLYGAAKVL